jgi:L,D-transpeptidase YcbB
MLWASGRFLAVLSVCAIYSNVALAQSVANPNTVAALSAVSAETIQTALNSANYINFRNSVINTRLIAPLYQARSNQPIFVGAAGLLKLRNLVSKVHLLGLNKEDYWNNDLETLSSNLGSSGVQAELLAAQAVVQIASDVSIGRANIQSIDQETHFRRSAFDGFQALNNALNSSDLFAGIQNLEPKHDGYVQLKEVLAKLHSVKESGGWSSLSGATALKPGKSSSDVPGVRQRLADLNYLSQSERSNSSTTYDSTLVDAVKAFQRGMKLDDDGICGRMCFGALKTSINQRIKQVEVNLERWRWLPKSLGSKHIFVNLARQELKVRENGAVVLEMNTVNGRLLRRTDTMVDKVYEVILNPTWTVPNSIAIKDIIPNQIRDPYYMSSSHIRVFQNNVEVDPMTIDWSALGNTNPYRIVQDPGPHNSLGTVKFSLTNSRAIYLHDTPHPEDFPLTTRLKSSGCVRLERPHDLAEYLLAGTQYDRFQIMNVISQYYMYPVHKVTLRNPVPVYLAYLTASVGDQGQVQFSPDYYGQDERMINASRNNEGF